MCAATAAYARAPRARKPAFSTRWRKIRPAVRPGGPARRGGAILGAAAPQSAERVLGPLRRTLQRHGGAIIAVVCFVIAAYLAVKGVRGF